MKTLGSLVAERPALAPVLESLGLDYCCGGHRSLEEAARERGLDPATLTATLDALAASPAAAGCENPATFSRPRLVEHIVEHHHAFVRREAPRLLSLASKVAHAHGPGHPELVEVELRVRNLVDALLPHLEEEEKSLFPALVEGGEVPAMLTASVREHEEAGALMARLRELTAGFAPTSWSCATHRSLMDALRAFEADLHQHVHLENNVLFQPARA